jgi:hypothetical protein
VMATGSQICIRRLHGPCRPRRHAWPGPPRALAFLFLFFSPPLGYSTGPTHICALGTAQIFPPKRIRLKI